MAERQMTPKPKKKKKEKTSAKTEQNEVNSSQKVEQKAKIESLESKEREKTKQSKEREKVPQKLEKTEQDKEIQSKKVKAKELSQSSFMPFPKGPSSPEELEKPQFQEKTEETQKSQEKEELHVEEKPEAVTNKVKDEYAELNKLEHNILKIAENILKLKRHDATLETERVEKMSPMVEELYHKCVAKLTHTLGYSKEEIFETIQDLEEKMWLVTDQRRTKKEIVESDLHQEILSFIGRHPGVHARDPSIEVELDITRNPFLKHIMTLEAFNLIRSVKVGRTLNYFLASVPEIFDDLCVLFKNPLIPSVINSFLANPTESVSAIADDLDVYHGAIQYHIKKLIKKEILRKEKKEGQNYYHVNRELLKRYNKIFEYPPFDL